MFFSGLRLTRGIRLQELAAKFGEEAFRTPALPSAELVEDGLMEQRGDRVCLTPRGRLLSNEVFERFILADDSVRRFSRWR